MNQTGKLIGFAFLLTCLFIYPASAATSLPFTVNLSKAVNVTGTPRIAVDVGGVTRYATYSSGSGSSALTFTYAMVAGDVDLDGVTVSSPIDLNGGTIKDLSGNDLSPLTFTVPNTSNVKINYPSLGMDFVYDADGRYTLNGTVYNDLTSFLSAAGGSFIRSSIGTYFDSGGVLKTAASGVPRFDYDPNTHAAKGILIEESRTNLLLQSDNYTNSPWQTTSCGGVTNSGSTTTAPNGTLIPIYDFASTACLFQDISITNGSTYTHSIWIKANKSATIGFRNPGSSAFTSTNITVGTTWQRYTITATADQATSRFLIDNRSFSGYGVTGLQLSFFGGQVEQGTFATSYIPTTTAAATRQADNLSIPIGSWYNSSLGTLYAGMISYNPDIAYSGPILDDSTSNNSINFIYNNNAGKIYVGGTQQFSFSLSNIYGVFSKTAMAYKSNDVAEIRNGTGLQTSSSSSIPTVSRLLVSGNSTMTGNIQTFKYYPSRIANTQLQLLTQ
ncbi:MAG: hypothetical protein A3J37_01555 [Alphaproteobacteria bacterium RIFCSPHIGHO2_12_FULL_45_9]|nr:MAG: hypothetical protein A3J37_01555 [Alphaproteobacteria bacterium RIFCSPHIGHO2_12_FULL_45_9]